MFKRKIFLEGKIFKSRSYGDFLVLEFLGKDRYSIEFIKTKYRTSAFTNLILKGQVRDVYFPVYCGLGYLGEKYNTTHFLNDRWKLLIDRCYNKSSKSYKTYGEKGCYVDERWFNFSNYVDDVINIEGYNEERVKSKELELDKNTKIKGNLKYSKETCLWITREENVAEMNRRTKQKPFIATRLEDGYTEESYNISKFCKKWNIKFSTSVGDCLLGRRNDYDGWKFRYKENENIYISKLVNTNKSGFKGVSFRKDRNKWRATGMYNGVWEFLGYYDNKKDAIIKRYEWEILKYGNKRSLDSKDEYLKEIGYIK